MSSCLQTGLSSAPVCLPVHKASTFTTSPGSHTHSRGLQVSRELPAVNHNHGFSQRARPHSKGSCFLFFFVFFWSGYCSTPPHLHTQTHAHRCARTHAHARTHMHARTHTYTDAHTHTHKHTQTHRPGRANIKDMCICSDIPVNACLCNVMLAHIHVPCMCVLMCEHVCL